MPETSYEKAIAQNLRDAGCSAKLTEQFLSLQKTGGKDEQLAFLSCHRKRLLDRLHQKEKQIDCLDYLVYRIQKEEPNEK